MSNERYTILYKAEELYSNLTQEEYMDKIEDLAQNFYEKGSPLPTDIETKITGE